jgi:hypothetical protein
MFSVLDAAVKALLPARLKQAICAWFNSLLALGTVSG